MEREKKLAKNTLILSIGTFLPKITAFITLPILTGYLSKAEYGQYDLIIVLVSLYLPALTLQIQTAAFRFLIDERDNEQEVKITISSIFMFILIISLIALVSLYFFLFKYDHLLRITICLYFFLDIFKQGLLQVARGLSRNKDYSISSIIYSVLHMLFAIIFVIVLRKGIVGAILAIALSSGISSIYLIYRTKLYKYINFKYCSGRKIKKLLAYSWPMVPNNLSMWVMRMSDRFIVTAFLGTSANAVYAVSNKIPNILSQFQNTITLAWQENAAIYSKDDDIDKYYSSMFEFFFSFIAGVLGLLIAVTPILFTLLIRGDYSDAYYQMPILFAGMFFSCMSSYLGGIYVAYKATKSVGVTTTLAAICNVVVNLLMIQWAELYAASISTLVSYIILFVYRLFDVKKLVNIRYHYKKMVCIIGLLIIECFICYINTIYAYIANTFIALIAFYMLNCKYVNSIVKKIVKVKR